MYFFTSDEHYNHKNIIKYCNRPFGSIKEMDDELIARHNSIVTEHDTTIHAGDFAFVKNIQEANKYFERLNGKHTCLKGSHDKWMLEFILRIWERTIEKQFIVVCHYAMRTWHRSHYNSWQLFGDSHGKLEPVGKQWDIGVDNNAFYPVSFDQIKSIMKDRPDNFNLVNDNFNLVNKE